VHVSDALGRRAKLRQRILPAVGQYLARNHYVGRAAQRLRQHFVLHAPAIRQNDVHNHGERMRLRYQLEPFRERPAQTVPALWNRPQRSLINDQQCRLHRPRFRTMLHQHGVVD
jgi:hypothetical protein